MDTLTGALKGAGQAVGKGAGGIASGIGHGVQGIVGSLPGSTTNDATRDSQTEPVTEAGSHKAGNDTTITSAVTEVLSGVTTSLFAPATEGLTLSRDAAKEGSAIGQKVLKSGLDTGTSVVSGTTSLAGTALGGVVAAAAETSGAVFEPVQSGLKTIAGLDTLGQGLEAINGLPLGAVKQVQQLTLKAMNSSGKTPTFFDTDADGVVTRADTLRGFVLLGLDEKSAWYAAFALHVLFAYPTSESWWPWINKQLPINVARMGRTSWGKNWGNFDRIDWVEDLDIDMLFADDKTWSDYLKLGRQGLGILLLIFEWGTTWPFYMPDVPIRQIPFSDDIGNVVRKAILPTILSNFKRARDAQAAARNNPTD